MNYNFDPETMYQPELPDVESFDECTLRYHSDGTVESLDDWPVVKSDYKGWNTYEWRGSGFRAYRVIAQHFWPVYPRELNCVDHINRCRGEDAFSNLRRISTSLNNLNQYRKGVKGYRYETSEWLSKANGWRIKRKMSPIILKEPPRNKYIANITYKGKPYELGVFRSAILLRRRDSFRINLETYGLSSWLPADLAELVLSYSNHIRRSPGGVAFVIFF